MNDTSQATPGDEFLQELINENVMLREQLTKANFKIVTLLEEIDQINYDNDLSNCVEPGIN